MRFESWFIAVAMVAAVPGICFAQGINVPEVTYPQLPVQAASASEFVPAGWHLEKQIRGDLNNDGLADAVLLLRDQDPGNVIKHSGLGENPLNTNPRILAVIVARAGGGYDLALDNHTLIARREDPTLDDPIDGVAASGIDIAHGTLQITLGRFYSAGSWGMDSPMFTFRWQGEYFLLVGYDDSTVQRNTGTINSVSVNYLSHRVKHTRGNIANDDEGDAAVTWTRLPSQSLLTLTQVGDGLEFDPGVEP